MTSWNIPQAVIVKAVDDDKVEGNHRTVIHHSCSSGDPAFSGATVDRVINVVDNDTPLIVRQPSDVSVLPGQTAVVSITAARVTGLTYQWYQGKRGDARRPIAGATDSTMAEITGDPVSDPARVIRIPHTGGEQLLVKLVVAPLPP